MGELEAGSFFKLGVFKNYEFDNCPSEFNLKTPINTDKFGYPGYF